MFHRLVTLQLYGAENTIADRSIISLSTVKRINITYSSKFAGIFTQNNPVTKVKNVFECLHSGDVLKDEGFFHIPVCRACRVVSSHLDLVVIASWSCNNQLIVVNY